MGLLGNLKSLFNTTPKNDVRARFEFLKEAISGTMSKFYKARDRQTGKIVGLKILDPKKLAFFESRFKGLKKPPEGEILQAVKHPNIVELYEFGVTPQKEVYLVMEFLEGEGLNFLLTTKNPKLDGNRLTIVRKFGEALQAVHDAGFIHRDICPRNVMVSPDFQTVKLIDFGLTVPAEKSFMLPGNRTGTPNYMAPELVKRLPTDKRLDVFAFGVSVYEIFTFQLPWERGTTGQVAMTHASQDSRPIQEYRPSIHPVLARAIAGCIEQDPEKRCPSIQEFLKQILRVEREDV